MQPHLEGAGIAAEISLRSRKKSFYDGFCVLFTAEHG
jgi:hypothetical protein